MPHYHMPDGEQLYVREIGQGEPVLVLSGLGMQSWQWLPFLLPYVQKFKFIIPDWRGFGGSKHCKIPANLDAIESHWLDIEALLKLLNLERTIVIAYSMGATTAMHGMQYGQFKDQIKSYLHIDQTPKITADDVWPYGLLGKKHPQLKQLLEELSGVLHQHEDVKNISDLSQVDQQHLTQLWISFIELQASDKITPKVFKLAFHFPKLQKHILPIQRLDYLTWYIDTYLNHHEDYREAVTSLKQPATFFIGEQSTLYPSQGQLFIANSLENSQHVLFHKSGHTPLITEPVKFSKEIGRFLKNSI